MWLIMLAVGLQAWRPLSFGTRRLMWLNFGCLQSLVVGFPGSASQDYKGFLRSGREEFAAQE